MTGSYFYVFAVDHSGGNEWVDGEFDTMKEALAHAINTTQDSPAHIMKHIYEHRIDGTAIWRDSRGSF